MAMRRERAPGTDSNDTDPNSPESLAIEGAHWLKFLGEADLVGRPIPYFDESGRQRLAEEFPLLYGSLDMYEEHVRRPLTTLERLPLDHPRRKDFLTAMRNVLHAHLDNPPPSS